MTGWPTDYLLVGNTARTSCGTEIPFLSLALHVHHWHDCGNHPFARGQLKSVDVRPSARATPRAAFEHSAFALQTPNASRNHHHTVRHRTRKKVKNLPLGSGLLHLELLGVLSTVLYASHDSVCAVVSTTDAVLGRETSLIHYYLWCLECLFCPLCSV